MKVLCEGGGEDVRRAQADAPAPALARLPARVGPPTLAAAPLVVPETEGVNTRNGGAAAPLFVPETEGVNTKTMDGISKYEFEIRLYGALGQGKDWSGAPPPGRERGPLLRPGGVREACPSLDCWRSLKKVFLRAR